MNFSPELWVALASAVVAICALFVTVYEVRQIRKHNRLSVRPLLTTMQNYDVKGKRQTFSFELINAGFGPAIIKDFILLYDGKEVSKNNIKKLEDFLLKKTRQFRDVKKVSFVPGSSLVAQERCEIFYFTYELGQDISFLEKLDLRVNYQSIYKDEVFTYDTKKDRLFHGEEASA